MPSIDSKPAKAQPWKAHWSPVSKSSSAPKAKAQNLVDKSGALLIDGDAGGGGWWELLGAQKEEKDAKE